MKKNRKMFSQVSKEAKDFANTLIKDEISRIDAYAYTDQKFGYIRGSTASYFGKRGAARTNKNKKKR